jgi:putative ABC transport system permease protein
MILTLAGLSRGMLEDAQTRARGVNADIFVRPPGSSVIGIAAPSMRETMMSGYLAKLPHVKMVSGTVVHPIGGINSIQGIDLAEFNAISGGFHYLEGGPFRGGYEAIIDQWYSEQNKIHAGDTINVANKDWKVTGVVEAGKLGRVFVPRAVLQDLVGATGKLSLIFIKLDDPINTPGVMARLKADLPDYPIYTLDEMVSQYSVSNVPGLKAFIYVIIGLSLVVGFLVVTLTMYAAVLERTREIGILKSLGAYPRDILSLLARETLLLAVGGWLMGIGLSYLSTWAINRFVGASLQAVTVPDWWPIAFGVAVTAALLGAIYPGLRAARLDAIEALSYE